jgi:hypothetical protein
MKVLFRQALREQDYFQTQFPDRGGSIGRVMYGNVDFGNIPFGMSVIFRTIAIIYMPIPSNMD